MIDYSKFENHTSGPWASEDSHSALITKGGTVICLGVENLVQNWQNNRHLIAAAPELLEENKRLKRAISIIASHRHNDITCSLEAQGYSPVEIAEIGAYDKMADIAHAALNGEPLTFEESADITQLRNALAFAASCIRSGEPYTPECEIIIGGALKRTGNPKPHQP